MTVSYNPGSQMLTIDWQPTCDVSDHALYYGSLGDFDSYTDAVCSVGMTGTVSVPSPAGDVFFLLVGHDGSIEGPYGQDGEGIERPSAMGAHCGYVQDLSHSCMP
jgi:hypothetical protein